MKTVRNLTAMAAVAATLTIAAQARADTLTFFLNTPECTGTCSTLPASISDSLAIMVVINRTDSTHATVTFTPPAGTTGVGAPVAINVSGAYTAFGTDPLAPTNPCGSSAPMCAPGGTNHLGVFTTETGAGTPSSIVITLTALNGNTWLTAASVLTPTTGAAAIYGHGFEAFAQDGLGPLGTGQFGGFYSPVPLPAALPLFATGLGALGLLGLRRKRKGAVTASA